MKLRCIKKYPILIQEHSFQKVTFGDIVDGKNETYAENLMKLYPGCFEKIEESEKSLKGYKNKMVKNDVDKEFC
jgi:hypothetical protein